MGVNQAPREEPGRILVGTRVTLELINDRGASEPMNVNIVDEGEADLDSGRLGVTTPLARAIVGRTAGSDVAYTMGDIRRVRVVAVEWAEHDHTAAQAADERRAAVDEARRRAVRTLSENVATSMNNKWGSYDLPDEPF